MAAGLIALHGSQDSFGKTPVCRAMQAAAQRGLMLDREAASCWRKSNANLRLQYFQEAAAERSI